MKDYKYRAFISYDHKDERAAARLHRLLESYPVPKSLMGRHSGKISPIFRDVAELTAHHSLSDKIQDAISQSQYLIVLCSPGSKKSHWVNQEIKLFREIHGDSFILCALIEGTPQTSFPPALLESGEEPLAANLSPKSFRLGVSQLAASILGVGLDDLVQRDLKKLRRRVTLITASAISALLIMGTLTWTAIDARQLAEQRRLDAEGQIEFMLTDLKDKLEAVGRLDALNAVGENAASYYDNYEFSDHDDDALGRRAEVFHLLGEIQGKLGNLDDADRYFQDAYMATEELFERNPDNPDRIFEHSQSAFWVGRLQYGLGNYDAAQLHFQSYLEFAKRLQEVEGDTERALQELAYAYASLGAFELDYGNLQKGAELLNKSLSLKETIFKNNSGGRSEVISLFNGYSSLASTALRMNDLKASITYLQKAKDLFKSSEVDAEFNFLELKNLRTLLHLYYINGDKDPFKASLEKAKVLIERLVGIDSENLDYQYEISLINIIEYEYLFSVDETSSLEFLKEKIETEYSKLKKADDKKSNLIEFLLMNIRVYHSLSNDENPSESINLIGSKLEDLNVISAPDVKELPYVLPSIILLQNWEENDIHTEILNQLCNDQKINLNYINRVILNSSPAVVDCPIAIKQNHQNSISKAAELFSEFNREKKNDK